MTPQGDYGERRPEAAQAGGGSQDSYTMWTKSPALGGTEVLRPNCPIATTTQQGSHRGSLGPPERTTLCSLPGPGV